MHSYFFLFFLLVQARLQGALSDEEALDSTLSRSLAMGACPNKDLCCVTPQTQRLGCVARAKLGCSVFWNGAHCVSANQLCAGSLTLQACMDARAAGALCIWNSANNRCSTTSTKKPSRPGWTISPSHKPRPTRKPTRKPKVKQLVPSPAPTFKPTKQPTKTKTKGKSPTSFPTVMPVTISGGNDPTAQPTLMPAPTMPRPTALPTQSVISTKAPSLNPTLSKSAAKFEVDLEEAPRPVVNFPYYAASGVKYLSSGEILICGSAAQIEPFSLTGGSMGFAVRYLANGELDRTFGSWGSGMTMLNRSSTGGVYDLAIQKTGNIILGGWERWDSLEENSLGGNNNGTVHFILYRILPNGKRDFLHFGENGAVRGTHNDSFNVISKVALDSNDTIFVTGMVGNSSTGRIPGSRSSIPVTKYHGASGHLDKSFGDNGTVLINASQVNNSQGLDLQIQPSDGKIVVVGNSVIMTNFFNVTRIVLLRLLSNGSLDGEFGDPTSPGITYTQIYTNGTSNAAALAMNVSETSFLVTGAAGVLSETGTLINEGFLAKYNSSGYLDSTFGTGSPIPGVVTLRISGAYVSFTDLAIQKSDEKIVCGGYVSYSLTTSTFILTRFDTSGALDLTFSPTGYILHSFLGNNFALSLDQSQDRQHTVLAGFAQTPGLSYVQVTEYLTRTPTTSPTKHPSFKPTHATGKPTVNSFMPGR